MPCFLSTIQQQLNPIRSVIFVPLSTEYRSGHQVDRCNIMRKLRPLRIRRQRPPLMGKLGFHDPSPPHREATVDSSSSRRVVLVSKGESCRAAAHFINFLLLYCGKSCTGSESCCLDTVYQSRRCAESVGF